MHAREKGREFWVFWTRLFYTPRIGYSVATPITDEGEISVKSKCLITQNAAVSSD